MPAQRTIVRIQPVRRFGTLTRPVRGTNERTFVLGSSGLPFPVQWAIFLREYSQSWALFNAFLFSRQEAPALGRTGGRAILRACQRPRQTEKAPCTR